MKITSHLVALFCVSFGLFFLPAQVWGEEVSNAPVEESLNAFYDLKFKEYPAPELKLGPKGKLQWRKVAKARKYRTRVIEEWEAAKEPNFAGRYVALKEIGCGSGCSVIFVVEWHTGEISTPPEDHWFEVRRNSRLLIQKPYDTCTAYGPPILLEFKNGKFLEVKHDKCLSKAN